jgi:hypothetical protein
MTLSRKKLSGPAGILLIVLLATSTPVLAATLTIPLSEADTPQPRKLVTLATPGVLLLCDSVGADSSVPLFKNGSWGCWSNPGNTGTLRDPSDVVTFIPRPTDKQFPTEVTFCSDRLGTPDVADSPCDLVRTGDFAIQEADSGTEQIGTEVTSYEPPGVGFPGFGTIRMGSTDFFLAFDLTSDIPKTPGPSTFLLLLVGLTAICLMRQRSRRTH